MSLKRRFGWAVGLLAVGLFAVNYTPAALAQDANGGQQQGQGQGRGGGGGRGGRGGFGGNNNGGGGRGNRDPAEMRLRMESRLKELLGASDQEWAVLQPKVEKLMDAQRLQMAGRGAGMAQLFRPDRGDRGGNNNNGGNNNRPNRPDRPDENSPVAVRTRELQDAIRDNASPDVLKAKLAALRDARTKAHDQYAKAQQELRELLTLKQEATLIMLGMLE
jgi:hypothetical protein